MSVRPRRRVLALLWVAGGVLVVLASAAGAAGLLIQLYVDQIWSTDTGGFQDTDYRRLNDLSALSFGLVVGTMSIAGSGLVTLLSALALHAVRWQRLRPLGGQPHPE